MNESKPEPRTIITSPTTSIVVDKDDSGTTRYRFVRQSSISPKAQIVKDMPSLNPLQIRAFGELIEACGEFLSGEIDYEVVILETQDHPTIFNDQLEMPTIYGRLLPEMAPAFIAFENFIAERGLKASIGGFGDHDLRHEVRVGPL